MGTPRRLRAISSWEEEKEMDCVPRPNYADPKPPDIQTRQLDRTARLLAGDAGSPLLAG